MRAYPTGTFSLVACAVIAMFLLAACGFVDTAAPAASNQVSVSAKEWEFQPKDLRAKAGEVTFTVKNAGNIEHNFSIEGVGRIDSILAGETKTFKVNLKAGTYAVVCDLSGHKEAGMETKLVVSP